MSDAFLEGIRQVAYLAPQLTQPQVSVRLLRWLFSSRMNMCVTFVASLTGARLVMSGRLHRKTYRCGAYFQNMGGMVVQTLWHTFAKASPDAY